MPNNVRTYNKMFSEPEHIKLKHLAVYLNAEFEMKNVNPTF